MLPINTIINGDCLERLKELEEGSVDSIVTDPPYELGFMGKSWDNTGIANNPLMWAECLRVLKPGGYLLSFGGTRTYHRMAVAIEDAGFEVRDMIEWVYGSGFPKSLNIGKAVDKIGGKYVDWQKFQWWLKENKIKSGYTNKQLDELLGFSTKGGGMFDHFINPAQAQIPRANTYLKIKEILELDDSFDELIETTERELVGKDNRGELKDAMFFTQNIEKAKEGGRAIGYGEWEITKGTSEWEGWGTALKPAHEPICMARKPLSEKTVAENVLKYGTGGINIDESRVAANWKEERPESWFNSGKSKSGNPTYDGNLKSLTESTVGEGLNDAGRFPANLIHNNSEEVRECFPESNSTKGNGKSKPNTFVASGSNWNDENTYADSGNASRFFKSIIYQAKASKSERNKGCEELEEKAGIRTNAPRENEDVKTPTRANNHPTVKPIALMEYLIKMVTPKGGTVLDPFAGSGSTLVAAKQNGFKYIGIEMTPEYIPIIEARLKGVPATLF